MTLRFVAGVTAWGLRRQEYRRNEGELRWGAVGSSFTLTVSNRDWLDKGF